MREHGKGRRLPEIIPCIVCGAVYSSLEGLQDHRDERHPLARTSASAHPHPRASGLVGTPTSGIKSSPEKIKTQEGNRTGPKTHPRMDARASGRPIRVALACPPCGATREDTFYPGSLPENTKCAQCGRFTATPFLFCFWMNDFDVAGWQGPNGMPYLGDVLDARDKGEAVRPVTIPSQKGGYLVKGPAYRRVQR